MEIDKILTKEFVEFSKKIAEIHEKIEAKKSACKEVLVKYKSEIAELEGEAKRLIELFEQNR
jgi:hypothetical protein